MIRIVTDSTSDLSAERAAQLGVEMLPLSVHFGEACYRDGVDITKGEFYEKLSRADKLPTTSQITPETFEAVFRRHIQAGDQVLGLFISSAMSGTCQSANIARSMVDEDNIAVPDTGTVTFGLGLLVETACLLRDQGLKPGRAHRPHHPAGPPSPASGGGRHSEIPEDGRVESPLPPPW